MDSLNTGYTWIPFMVQLAQWGIPVKVRDTDNKVLPTAAYFLSAGIMCVVPYIQAVLRRRKKYLGREMQKEWKKQGLKFCVFCIAAIAALTGAAGCICDYCVENVCVC